MAASDLQIPASAVEPLESLLDLSDDGFATLMSVLDDETVGGSAAAGVDRGRLAELPVEPNELVGTFVSLDLFREAQGWSPAEAADRITGSPDLSAGTSEHALRFRLRVEMLLTSESVALMGAAVRGELASERVFERADVVTDVRPGFGSGEFASLPAVVLHTFRLMYRSGGRSESLFVTLDDDDLVQLEQAIAAARQNATALAGALRGSGLRLTGAPWRLR